MFLHKELRIWNRSSGSTVQVLLFFGTFFLQACSSPMHDASNPVNTKGKSEYLLARPKLATECKEDVRFQSLSSASALRLRGGVMRDEYVPSPFQGASLSSSPSLTLGHASLVFDPLNLFCRFPFLDRSLNLQSHCLSLTLPCSLTFSLPSTRNTPNHSSPARSLRYLPDVSLMFPPRRRPCCQTSTERKSERGKRKRES
eukprot:2466786-Rhodomonas_salina.1